MASVSNVVGWSKSMYVFVDAASRDQIMDDANKINVSK